MVTAVRLCVNNLRCQRWSIAALTFLAAPVGQAHSATFPYPDIFSQPAIVALHGLEKPYRCDPIVSIFLPELFSSVVALRQTHPVSDDAKTEIADFSWELLPNINQRLALAIEAWRHAPELRNNKPLHDLREKIAGLYRVRNFAPLWIEDEAWREGAASTISRLSEAMNDGLDLRAYRLPSRDKLIPDVDDELALSEAVAAYALQARGARIDPDQISHLIGAKTTLPDPGQAIIDVANAKDLAGDTLVAFNPPHRGYQQLRQKLIELHALRATAATNEKVVENVTGALQSDLRPPIIKSKSHSANKPAANTHLEAEIIANMERWRWLPRDLGTDRIEVNIPDYELAVVRSGVVTHRTRVIVGKETTPTPIFSDSMEYIIINPYWNVPQSIIHKEMMPNGGPGEGFKVSYSHGQMVVRQPPGPSNALGRMKFVFPNDYAVYMHDTQSRNLFAVARRAFSHGCMRVQYPFALAEAVLNGKWSIERLEKLIGSTERYITLSQPLPVHIEYFTTYVNETGQLIQRQDLYGYSLRVRRALGLSG